LRQQAREWLWADLALWAGQAGGDDAERRRAVQETLRRWQTDPDLAGVRDAGALTRLPEGERAPWVQFWEEVAARLRKAGEAKGEAPP
jgi:hypothetical protein